MRDAEAIRAELGVEKWSVLGQSFGGFCVDDATSRMAPEGLREAFVTGGLAPVGRPVDDVYRATYERALERNRRYYERYPEDRARVRALVERLDAEDVRLPTGDRLTARRFRQAGNLLGMSDGAEDLHASSSSRPTRPPSATTSRTPRLRAQPDLRDPARGLVCRRRRDALVGGARLAGRVRARRPELLTGEHVYPWMFEDYGALAPLREAAEMLADHEWPRLYDAERLRRERGPGRGGDLRRGPVRRARVLGGDRRADPRPARLGHQRVRAQRPARGRRAHPRTADRPRPGTRIGAALLELEHVTRRFGGVVALDDVSLSVERGEIAGLIGPNGAGKTTAFNVITRLYKPESGTVAFDGSAPADAAVRSRPARDRAHLPERRALLDDDRARERPRRGALARRPRGRAGREILEYVGLGTSPSAGVRLPTRRESGSSSPARSSRGRGCCCSTSRRAGSATRRWRGSASSSGARARSFGLTVLLVEHHMNLVMRISDSVTCSTSAGRSPRARRPRCSATRP